MYMVYEVYIYTYTSTAAAALIALPPPGNLKFETSFFIIADPVRW